MTLLHHYRFEDSVIDSVGNQNGTITGSLTYSSGKLGKSLTFTRSISNYVTLPNAVINNLTDFSISCWINSADIQTTTNYYFSLANTSTADYITLGLSPTLGVLVVLNAITYYNFPSSFSNNTWYHIVVEREQTTLRVYINGSLINSVSCLDTVLTASGAVILGQEQDSVGGTFDVNKSFNGSIDDLRIYDHALSLNEVKELYQAKYIHYTFDTFEEPTTNLVIKPEFSDGTYTGWDSNQLYPGTISIVNESGVNYLKFVCDSTNDNSGVTTTSLPVQPNTTYTLSIKARKSPGSTIFLSIYNNATGTYIIDPVIGNYSTYDILQEHYTTYSITFTTPASASTLAFGLLFRNPTAGSWVMFTNVQIEQKPYATPFTTGTRTGVVRDSSGQGKDITIEENYTPRWVNTGKLGSGCYTFKGSTRICTNSGITLGDTVTVTGWGNWDGLQNCMLFSLNSNSHSFGPNLYLAANTILWNIGDAATNPFKNNGVNVSQPTTNVWHHYAVVTSPALNKAILYLDGAYYGEASIYRNPTQTNKGLTVGNYYPGSFLLYSWKGAIDDFRIYNSVLTESEIQQIYKTRASMDNTGTLSCSNINETGYKPLLLNYTIWQNGQTGSVNNGITYFNQNGQTEENFRVLAKDPWGKETVVWEARSSGSNGPNGGWGNSFISVDNTKTYRVSTWVRRTVLGNGRFYLGTQTGPLQLINRLTGETDGNPYFWYSDSVPSNMDDWILVVGHVWPVGSGIGALHPDSGIYNVQQGRIGDISLDFVFNTGATSVAHRSYLYYSSDPNTRQQWVYPRIDVCDGTEPSIAELLGGYDSRNFEYTKAMNGITKEPFRLGMETRAVDMPETIGYYTNWSKTPAVLKDLTLNTSYPGILRVTSTSTDPYFYDSPTYISLDPNKYKYLHIKYRYISGTPSPSMQFFFTNSTYTFWNENLGVQFDSVINDGLWHEAIVDCTTNPLFTSSNITGIRVDPCITSGTTIEFEYLFMSSIGTETVLNPGPLNVSDISECSVTNGLVHWYPLNGDTVDYVGRYDGTNYSAVPKTRGYYFDGVATKYIRATTQTLSPTSLTISCWVRKEAHSVSRYPIFLSFGLPYISSDNSASFRVSYNASAGQINTTATFNNVLGEWYLLTATFNTDGVRLYVNGIYQGINTSPATSVGNIFDIGRHYGNDNYRINGYVSDVRIYNRPLSSQEIKTLYETTNPNSTTKASLSENTLYVKQVKEN